MKLIAENVNPINTLTNTQLFYMMIAFLMLLVMGISSPVFIILRHTMILRGETETYKDVIISKGMRAISVIFIVLIGSFVIACILMIK